MDLFTKCSRCGGEVRIFAGHRDGVGTVVNQEPDVISVTNDVGWPNFTAHFEARRSTASVERRMYFCRTCLAELAAALKSWAQAVSKKAA